MASYRAEQLVDEPRMQDADETQHPRAQRKRSRSPDCATSESKKGGRTMLLAAGLCVSEEVLGKGGQGVVLASEMHGLRCATKIVAEGYKEDLNPKLRTSMDSMRTRMDSMDETNPHDALRHEAFVLRHVQGHQNVVEIVDFVEGFDEVHEKKYSALVLERFGTRDLYSIVYEKGGLDEPVARDIFAQILSAVVYIHSKGVCHRDLKPENVLVDETTMQVKLIDFGLSRILANPTGKEAGGMFPGSSQYTAPELALGHHWNAGPVDVFSLGVLLYVMLYGEFPRRVGRRETPESETPAQRMIRGMMNRKQEKRPSLQEVALDPWLAIGVNVGELDFSGTDVTDVSALAGCSSLHTLHLSHTKVTDVSALACCSSLHTLDLQGSEVTDVSALAGCPSLHTLDLRYTRVTDVSGLAGCSCLHTLKLSSTRVTDVSALVGCLSLHTLNLSCTKVMNVSALAACSSLRTLDLSATPVSDVSALAGCSSLQTLNLFNTDVTGVSALAGCPSLRTLDLRYTRVTDVSVLAGCPSLRTLDLRYTRVTDVSAFAGCPSLRTLDLRYTHVRDVSALVGCPGLHTIL